jgi:hypothetical protein
MGKYFNPPHDIKVIGRPLHGSFSIEGLKRQLREDEILIGLFNSGTYLIAPVLEDQTTYTHFDGVSLDSCFFALDKCFVDEYVSSKTIMNRI